MPAHLIDTNVMLASSAIYNALSNLANEAMPQEPELREIVFNALRAFEESEDHLVLDEEGTIRNEYDRNMPFNNAMAAIGEQEYGQLVIQKKLDYSHVNWVTIDLDNNGHGALSEELSSIVTDREDRKWVAAAQAHIILYENNAPITYGAESDWYVIESALAPYGIEFRRLLPEEWYQE